MSNKHLDLPWYVNNSLDADARRAIDTELSNDAELKLELEFLQQIRQQIKTSHGPTPGEIGWQKLRRQVNRSSTKPKRLWQGVAIAASLMLIVQGVIIVSLMQSDNSYVPLSGTTNTQAILQIRFNPDVREAEIRQLLQAINGQIIDGPSANHLYRVTLQHPEKIKQYITTLRANNMVDHVAQD